MGDRSYIQISSERLELPVILYGHWSGSQNIQAVRNVLEKTARIGDPSYLVAQITYEFFRLGEYDGSLSFGIDNGYLTDSVYSDNPTAYVDADTGIYTYNGVEHYEYSIISEKERAEIPKPLSVKEILKKLEPKSDK